MGTEGDVVIITGTSGTGIKKALDTYRRLRSDVKVASLEDYLPEVARPLYRELEGTGAGTVTLLKLLQTLPHPTLQALWPHAFKNMWEANGTFDKESTHTLFVHFHAAWYHIASDRFISEVSHPVLQDKCGGRTRMVVTLLDDIYDTYVRLSRDQELFSGHTEFVDNPITVLTSALLRILEWREMEIRFAQQCAKTVNAPHFIFAVKHPVETFDRLVSPDKGRVRIYLAHPISVPRKSVDHGGYGGLQTRDSERLLKFIGDVARELRSNDEIVLFEPTSVDELRYPAKLSSGRELTDRWPLPKDEHGTLLRVLADPLRSGEGEKALHPFKYILQGALSPEELEESFGAIEVLKDHISRQINWRDRQLVEQSEHLVQVRPCASHAGEVSGGVAEEATLHSQLLRSKEQGTLREDRGRAFIYHPEADEERRQRGAVLDTCIRYEETGKAANVTARRDELMRLLEDVPIRHWRDLEGDQLGREMSNLFSKMSEPDRPTIVPSRGVSVMRTMGRRKERSQLQDELGRDIKKVLDGVGENEAYNISPFRGSGCERLEGKLTAAELAQEIKSALELG